MSIRPPRHLIKIVAFGLVSVLMTGTLLGLLQNNRGGSGATTTYSAAFSDASYLKSGDEVRIAGVPVGQVTDVELHGQGVMVTFDAAAQGGLPSDVSAAIRYKDLLGARYVALLPGRSTTMLPAGGTIPESRTQPAVDLEALTGGFKPLLRGLDAGQVNALSFSMIRVLQGESGAVGTMLSDVASFTSTLADRSSVITGLITNLRKVVGTLDRHGPDLDHSIVQAEHLVQGLAAQRRQVIGAVKAIDTASRSTAGLLAAGRPPLRVDLANLGSIAGQVNRGSAKVNAALQGLGPALDALAGIGVYGDFFNFYLCDIRVRFSGPGGPIYTPWANSSIHRCNGRPAGAR